MLSPVETKTSSQRYLTHRESRVSSFRLHHATSSTGTAEQAGTASRPSGVDSERGYFPPTMSPRIITDSSSHGSRAILSRHLTGRSSVLPPGPGAVAGAGDSSRGFTVSFAGA